MRGPEGAAQLVAAWLTTRLPARLALLEQSLGLAAGELGTPALVLPYDKLRLAVEEWPAILVVGQTLKGLGPADVDSDRGDTYRARYNLRVFVWARGEDELATDQTRSRYLLATREALLERLSLATAGATGAPPVAIDPLSLTESYSGVMVDDAGATIAGAWIDVDVLLDEVLTPVAPPAHVETVRADTATLPTHPAFG